MFTFVFHIVMVGAIVRGRSRLPTIPGSHPGFLFEKSFK